MTYLDYILFFEKQDRQQPKGFSGKETRLYLKLLHLANLIGNGGPWPAEFFKSDPYVAAVAGMSVNTMKECREKLVAGGLLAGSWGEKGYGKMGTYRLLGDEKRLSKTDSSSTERVSTSDSLPPERVSISDSFSPENGEKLAERLSISDTLILEEERESSAANAAPTLSASPIEEAAPPPARPSKPAPKKGKRTVALPEEIAALPLPHTGPEFASTWAELLNAPKQQGKSLYAYKLLLKKLGKYAEPYAVLMMEKAIENNWQGVEYDGTAAAYARWQAEQPAGGPATAPTATPASPTAHDELFGLTRSAADGLAAARDTPEYRAYQVRQQAAAPAAA